MTDVTIIATTWLPDGKAELRLTAFQEALASWMANLRFEGTVHLHVADDGTEEPWFTGLKREITGQWFAIAPVVAYLAQIGIQTNPEMASFVRGDVSFSSQPRKGLGASLNSGLSKAFERSPIVLHAVDDWELLAPLDLDPWVKLLEDDTVGMVRFFPHPDLRGDVKHLPGIGSAMKIEHHHFAFGLRPALMHQRLFDSVGSFQEEVSALACEYNFNERWCLGGSPDIYLALPELWRHLDPVTLSDVQP